jgi:hypothetical protein
MNVRQGLVLFVVSLVIAAVLIFVIWPAFAGVCVWNTTSGSIGSC